MDARFTAVLPKVLSAADGLKTQFISHKYLLPSQSSWLFPLLQFGTVLGAEGPPSLTHEHLASASCSINTGATVTL